MTVAGDIAQQQALAQIRALPPSAFLTSRDIELGRTSLSSEELAQRISQSEHAIGVGAGNPQYGPAQSQAAQAQGVQGAPAGSISALPPTTYAPSSIGDIRYIQAGQPTQVLRPQTALEQQLAVPIPYRPQFEPTISPIPTRIMSESEQRAQQARLFGGISITPTQASVIESAFPSSLMNLKTGHAETFTPVTAGPPQYRTALPSAINLMTTGDANGSHGFEQPNSLLFSSLPFEQQLRLGGIPINAPSAEAALQAKQPTTSANFADELKAQFEKIFPFQPNLTYGPAPSTPAPFGFGLAQSLEKQQSMAELASVRASKLNQPDVAGQVEAIGLGIAAGLAGLGAAIIRPDISIPAIAQQVTHPTETLEQFQTALKEEPYGTTGQFIGQIIGSEILGAGFREFTGRVKPLIESKISPAFTPIEKTGIEFVPSTTVPITQADILAREGTTSTGIHVTLSKAFDDFNQVLIKAQTDNAGALRTNLEQFSFFKSLEGEKPRAYLGYAGIGDLGSEKPTIKYSLFPPKIKALIFPDELISFTPKGLSAEEIQAFQGLTTGKTFIPAENILGLSGEAQTVTPAEIKYQVSGRGIVDGASRKIVKTFDTEAEAQAYATKAKLTNVNIEFKGYRGSIIEKKGGFEYTLYPEKRALPKFVEQSPFLKKISESLTLDVKKFHKIQLVKAETLPVLADIEGGKGTANIPRVFSREVSTEEIFSSQNREIKAFSDELTKNLFAPASKSAGAASFASVLSKEFGSAMSALTGSKGSSVPKAESYGGSISGISDAISSAISPISPSKPSPPKPSPPSGGRSGGPSGGGSSGGKPSGGSSGGGSRSGGSLSPFSPIYSPFGGSASEETRYRRARKKYPRPRRRKAPSLVAVAFDIRGAMPKGTLTGLEIRPLQKRYPKRYQIEGAILPKNALSRLGKHLERTAKNFHENILRQSSPKKKSKRRRR